PPLPAFPSPTAAAPTTTPAPFPSFPASPSSFHPIAEPLPDFTDADLFEALTPLFQETLRNSGFGRDSGIDQFLEPMLRATIRRALAEYSPASRPFQGPGSIDRLVWHLQALFTSRT